MSTATSTEYQIDDCWNRTGIWGRDAARCPRLQEVVHCQNCPVYSDAGRRLLDRPLREEYRDEWTENLRQARAQAPAQRCSALVLRLGAEWFALDTAVVVEITQLGDIHSVPHAATTILKGLVNIRGELHLCVSLGALLGVEKSDDHGTDGRKIYDRIVVIERGGERYVFPVSEIKDIFYYDPEQRQAPPSTLAHAAATYVTGVVELDGMQVGRLDTELLFHGLSKNIT
ncbi:MAG: chemotaxis protein CheW [Gammaproteobacteria bacterium]|nr:chemotaxis protein CheW [Gammaproteobacteria bacterium]NIR28836.1 chemotaxis protein CheW [Gammaproteobacteria bacterium]NIR97217.1 chemotaxis protein CheW [Gammaproteobacteria bacterium]NIT62928.1 chemotaxis protein CheW [Gammaproteobacteria bacterium]NIV19898.1 chemotaxis protein CheW [Gammaproteobacteria bacterium]